MPAKTKRIFPRLFLLAGIVMVLPGLAFAQVSTARVPFTLTFPSDFSIANPCVPGEDF